jgi:site-specific recombinase XerC
MKKLVAARVSTAGPDRPVFVGAKDVALTRFGIYKIIRRYTTHVVKQRSDGRLKAVSPHVWRHSTAVHFHPACPAARSQVKVVSQALALFFPMPIRSPLALFD